MNAHPDPCAACTFDVAAAIREAQAEADAVTPEEKARLRRDPLRDMEQAFRSENRETRAIAATWFLLERDAPISGEQRLDAAEYALASGDAHLRAVSARWLLRQQGAA